MAEPASSAAAAPRPTAKRLLPGYLLDPLGWAAQPLADMVAAGLRLLTQLFELDRPRMHLIGLALAHLDGPAVPRLGPLLLCASTRQVLDHVLQRPPPPGIKRALRRLPSAVLSPHSYRRLVQLLDHPPTAKLLHHLTEPEITDGVIRLLDQVPPSLQSVSLALLGLGHRLDHLPDGLRFLVARGAAPSFDALVADLAAQSQPAQFIARLKRLVATLPLPHAMPPAQIEQARRLDATGDICALAECFHNCLADYVEHVDAGRCAIYLWDDPTSPAACEVNRHGRLGWFLGQALGPRNVALAPQQLQHIRHAFAGAGVPDASIICAIEYILESDWQHRTRLRLRPR